MNADQIAETASGVLGALLRNFHKTDAEKAKRRLCSKCEDERPVCVYDEETGNVEVVAATELAAKPREAYWMTPDILNAVESMDRKDILVVILTKAGDTCFFGFRHGPVDP